WPVPSAGGWGGCRSSRRSWVLILAARDRRNQGQLITILERSVRLGIGAVEGEGDVVEMIGKAGKTLAELVDGRGDRGFFGEIEGEMIGPSAIFEEGEKTDRNAHGMHSG